MEGQTVSAKALLDALDDAIAECAAANVGAFDRKDDADALDKLTWHLRKARDDLAGNSLRKRFILREVRDGFESIGLGRLDRWEKEGLFGRAFALYGICSAHARHESLQG